MQKKLYILPNKPSDGIVPGIHFNFVKYIIKNVKNLKLNRKIGGRLSSKRYNMSARYVFMVSSKKTKVSWSLWVRN